MKIAKIETVNDLDGFVANFWRAVTLDPEATARWADWPINETDLNARHAYLVAIRERLTKRLEGDPDYFDARLAVSAKRRPKPMNSTPASLSSHCMPRAAQRLLRTRSAANT